MLKPVNLGGSPARRRARKYKVSVESGPPPCSDGGEVEGTTLEKGPYTAETYSASVDEKYVVVEIL